MAIGIYFDDKGAVAVRVEGSAKKARIAACAELEWEAPSPEADADARKEARKDQLKTWLKKNKLLGQPVALCLDSSHVLFRDMHMAFGDRRQIDKVITFQVEGLIPSTPIEELAVGYTILDSNEEGSQLLVSAAHKGPLREQIELLDSVKTSAELADSTIGGALNLRPFIPELAHVEEPTAWVDVQGGRAMIAVLVDDKIKSVRNLLIPLPAVRELAAAREDGADDEGSAKTATGDSTDTADFEDIKDSTAEQPFSDELVDEDAPEDKASDDIDFDDDNDEQVGEVTDAVVVLDHGDSGRLPQIKAAEPLDDSRGSEPSFTAPLVATESSHDMLSGDSTSEPPAASDASFIGAPNEPTLFAPKVQSTAGRQSPAEALAKLLTLELRRAIVGSQAGAIKRVVLTGVPQSLHEHLKGLKRDLEIR
ncbi:MAG: hypothetical protein L6Q71_11135, partial [Planctomycetes bacterium]|nr:hypothetical protein [Planctomycetota bacterium]